MLGHPEWRDDPRFRTNSDRMANLPALVALMNDVLATRDQGRVDRARSTRRACRSGRCNTIGEALAASADARARHGGRDRCTRRPGATQVARLPGALLGDADARSTRPAPMLGEHTREVLAAAGYTDAEIDALVAEGVVATA